MIFKIEFNTNIPHQEIISESKKYFLTHGFLLAKSDSHFLCFERGSILKNAFTFNPLKWKSKIEIWANEGNVTASFNINPIFQTVTQEEAKLWEGFIENYRVSIETGQSSIEANKLALVEVRKSSFKYFLAALKGAMILGIPGGFLAYFTGIHSIASVSIGIGATIFLMNSVEKQKQEKANKF